MRAARRRHQASCSSHWAAISGCSPKTQPRAAARALSCSARVRASRTFWSRRRTHFFDAGTLPLALSVFQNLRARALLINTVHRSAGGDPPPEDEDERRTLARSRLGTADLAHADQSFYLSAHRQLVRLFDRAPTVQLHGFRDEVLPGVGCVVSPAGSKANAKRVVLALRPVLGDKPPALYPSDVKRLGGTLNAQARDSVAQRAPFLHLELSRSLRDELLRDADRRTRFARAIGAGLLSGSD